MTKLRVAIADDEAPARRELKYLLGKTESVDIVGEAATGSDALRMIIESRPQVVFLDVQMPSMTGLELSNLLRRLPEKPLVIFSTAYEKYALAAFDVEAFDYILKPFTFERVNRAVQRAISFIKTKETGLDVESDMSENKDIFRKLPLYKGEKIIPVSPGEIYFIRVESGDTVAMTKEGTYRTKSPLNELEAKLGRFGFVRVHRSALVNIDHVKEVIPWYNGGYKLVMDDAGRSEILVSRYNVKILKRYFNI